MRILCLILILASTSYGYDYEWQWIRDFSGGLRTDLSPIAIPINSALQLENAVIDGTSLILRPGYTVYATRIDSLAGGAARSPVRPVRGLYEFYNDVSRETQILAVIHDHVWWRAVGDSIRWHPIGLSSGAITLTQNDSIVVEKLGLNWWPRMLPDDGDDWHLYAQDSVLEVYRVIGNKALLDDPWLPSTVDSSTYALTPIFDSNANIQFSTSNETCFISDGIGPVRQWKNNQTQNGYFIIDSATVDTIGGPGTQMQYVSFSDSLTLDLVDSIGDYYVTRNCLAIVDTLVDSAKVHFCPIFYSTTSGLRRLYVVLADRDTNLTLEKNKAYVTRPLSDGYNFEPDTVYTGTVSFIPSASTGNIIMLDTSQSWSVDEFNSGVYRLEIYDSRGDSKFTWGSTKFYACEIDTDLGGGTETYVGLQVTSQSATQVSAVSIGDSYSIIRQTYYPHTHFTAWRQGRMWFVGSPTYPNTAWWSMQFGSAGLETTNYFDDVRTTSLELVGAGDKDEMTGLSIMQAYLQCYKRNHIYHITGNQSPFDIYEKSGNYGLWSDGFLVQYMGMELGMHRMGPFGFNGANVVDHNQIASTVQTFFTDSLNLSEIERVRGELYDNYMILSMPVGGSAKNNKTLVLDMKTGAWSSWSFAAASYLTRRSPNGLDTLLWGDPDSTTIYLLGGSQDAGTAIDLTYQSPYMDFGSPDWKKQLRKIQIEGQANSGCSLAVYIYAEDLTTAEYTKTIGFDTLYGYNTPQRLTIDLPPSIENTTRFSVKIVSQDADSLKIDVIGLQYQFTTEVGAQ